MSGAENDIRAENDIGAEMTNEYHRGTFISPWHFQITRALSYHQGTFDSTYILFARQVLRVLPVNLYIEDNRLMSDTASDLN